MRLVAQLGQDMRKPRVVAYRMPPRYPADRFRTVPAEVTSAASAPFKLDCQKPRENPVGMSFGVEVPYKKKAADAAPAQPGEPAAAE